MLMRTESTQLLLLLNWMSPTFPIGSFAYSHGLEQAIADGRLKDVESVEAWIADLLLHGSGWNDAVIFARCWHNDISELNALALALAGSRERYLETTQLGRAFAIAAAVWTRSEPQRDEIAYAVAAGRACRNAGVPQEQALVAFVQGFCAALVSVAVRLVPLGQTQGLEVLRNLASVIQRVSVDAAVASLDDIGGCSIAADIAAMQHETLETRIFRT
jgi:urease accessory protein